MEQKKIVCEHCALAGEPGTILPQYKTIRDLEHRTDLVLVTDSQDVQAVKDSLPVESSLKEECEGFFVATKDGEYTEVYGFYSGYVPAKFKAIIFTHRSPNL